MEQHQEILSKYLKDISLSGKISRLVYQKGKQLYEMGHCYLLASSTHEYEYMVKDDYKDFETKIIFNNKSVEHECSCKSSTVCSHVFAAANQTFQDLSRSSQIDKEGALKYSREGMIKRVLEERENRVKQETYQLDFSDNIYGEHHLFNEQGKRYEINFYDFSKKLGYCSCPDYQTNKLETCKHLMHAFKEFEKENIDKELPKQAYPYIEVFRHPLFDYQISWFYPHTPNTEIESILHHYFDDQQLYKYDRLDELHIFLEDVDGFKSVKIRPEVRDFIEAYYEEKSLIQTFSEKSFKPDLLLKPIYPFQKEGITFISSHSGCILADEIGTGKSVQALGAALHKIEVLSFESVKILSPKHLLNHWDAEIQKWMPSLFIPSFKVESFEEINTKEEVDFLIIDEAQKITDYHSSLLQQLHQINFKHILLITDSKIEHSLIKFYAMAGLIDKHLLTPLWELSYKHCLFDPENPDEIVGYYNLDQLPNRLKDIYLRREKHDIGDQLPKTNRVLIPIALNSPIEIEQSSLSQKFIDFSNKRKPVSYDYLQMKSVIKNLFALGQYTNSTTSDVSPKLEEFKHFISHKLNLSKEEKVVVFINDVKVQKQVQMLLQKERKSVQILSETQDEFPHHIQFFITSEKLQKALPDAHHFVYYHIPNILNAIMERTKMLEESSKGAQQNRIYLLLASQSMESIIQDWVLHKPFLLNQVSDFLFKEGEREPLNLRLQEELSHELQSFIQKAPDSNTQMNLFGESVISKKKKTSKVDKVQHNDLATFFETMLKSFSALESLDKKTREKLLHGSMNISEEEGEVIIRIKPNTKGK